MPTEHTAGSPTTRRYSIEETQAAVGMVPDLPRLAQLSRIMELQADRGLIAPPPQASARRSVRQESARKLSR